MTESKQFNLKGITLPPGHDPRLDVLNQLSAIVEHDPFLTPFERADVEKVMGHLDKARAREDEEQARKPFKGFETGIMDPVQPANWRKQ